MRMLGRILTVVIVLVLGATMMFFALRQNPQYVVPTDPTAVAPATPAPAAPAVAPATPAPAAPAVAPATAAPGEVNVQQWLNLKSEVDAWCPVGDLGKWHCDTRIATPPGQLTAMGVEFRSALSGTLNRFVCDDTCGKIYLLYPDQRVLQLQIVKAYGPNFDYQTLTQAEQQLAASYGVNVAGSEILAQNFVQDFAAPAGSVLVITGADDPTKGAFRGVFASSVFVSPEATPFQGGDE